MPNYDWECESGHIFERITNYRKKVARCPECGKNSERIWMAPRSPHRQLQTPIVMWRYADGSLGIAGGADSITPPNAERVELRSFGEYQRAAKTLNSQHRGKEQRREEAFLAMKERMEHEQRSRLSYLMGQESDPVARDIYREALEHNKGGNRSRGFQEYYSIAMENDKSNYE